MYLTDQIGFLILILTMGAQLTRRSFLVRVAKFITPVAAVFIFSIVSYWSVLQYRVFEASTLSRLLLPPHMSIFYFLRYVGNRFFSSWLLALAAAVLISGIADYLNRKYGERFFEKEELSFIRIGVFLTGYPGFLFYLIIALTCGVAYSAYYSFRFKERASFYYLWLPAAIFAMIIKTWFIPDSFLAQFNI